MRKKSAEYHCRKCDNESFDSISDLRKHQWKAHPESCRNTGFPYRGGKRGRPQGKADGSHGKKKNAVKASKKRSVNGIEMPAGVTLEDAISTLELERDMHAIAYADVIGKLKALLGQNKGEEE